MEKHWLRALLGYTLVHQAPIKIRDSANAFIDFQPLNKNMSMLVWCIHQAVSTRYFIRM